jgi:Sulfite exporter TauE/SafE
MTNQTEAPPAFNASGTIADEFSSFEMNQAGDLCPRTRQSMTRTISTTVRKGVAALCTVIFFTSIHIYNNKVLRSRNIRRTVLLTRMSQFNITRLQNSIRVAPASSEHQRIQSQHSVFRKIVYRTLRLRCLEDSNEENEADGNDDNKNNQDNNGNEDSRDRGPRHDDFFREFIEDDDMGVQQEAYYHWDDSYFSWDVIDTIPKLLPIDRRKLVGFFIAFVGMLLGASGGAGGGGVVVPIYILVLGLPIQAAIPVGAMTILGAAIAATCLNWHRRHPLADRVLIDWDLILIMEPVILVGTLVGTLAHRLLNDKILVVLLVLLLSFAAHTTLAKAFRMYHAENRYLKLLRVAQEEHPLSGCPSLMSAEENLSSIHTAKADLANGGFINYSKMQQEEKEKIREMRTQEILILNPDYIALRSELLEQEKFAPRSKIVAVLGIVMVLAFLTIMVGGGPYFTSPWGIECASLSFWIVHIIMIAFLVASAWAAQTYVIARHEIKKLVRFDYVHGDIQWDTRSAITYPAVFVMAGLFAGTLGIGGGGKC